MDMKFHRYMPHLFIAFLFAVIFAGYLSGQKVLLGTDAVIASANQTFSDVLNLIKSGWKDSPLMGVPVAAGMNFLRLLKVLFHNGILWNNWYHGLGCLLASFLLLRYLRSMGVSMWAATLSALAAFWLGVNLTIVYAGHPAKPYIVMLFVAALLPVSKAVCGSLPHSILWGGCVGLMFVHQPDVALFFALFSGAYLLFRLFKENGFKSPVKWIRVLVPALLFAFLFACGPLLGAYKSRVKDTVQTQLQTPQQKWDYMTQWSFPPDESLAFIAPGYTGWRSGEADGPYWGRMGRSAGWEKTHQGFRNFKLENMYIGVIPIAFAVFALFFCKRSKHRAEIVFWAAAAGVTLMLSFGKFFPLYSLFYKLPVVNNIRNPNKFLQVFQVCMAILTAYGVDALFSRPVQDDREMKNEPVSSPGIRAYFWGMIALMGILGAGAMGLVMGMTGEIGSFVSDNWPQAMAKAIVENKIKALWYASFMALVVAVVFAFFGFPRFAKLHRFKNWVAALLILLVAGDAVRLSKHYVREMPKSYVAANPLTDFLKQNLGYGRVAIVQEQGIFGIFKTYTLPYNGIDVFNPGDLSRMPTDYQAFLKAAQRDPLALWEFSGVKYLLAPAALEQQVPPARVGKVFSFGVRPLSDGGFALQTDARGPYAVFELKNALPRYALFAGSRKMSDEESLRQIGDLTEVSLSADSGFQELSGNGMTGSVRVKDYHPGRVVLSVDAVSNAVLRCAERYTSDWKARLDGQSVPVEPVDYLCQGVFIPTGDHEVELYYDASKGVLHAQFAGYLVLVAALVWSFRRTATGCPKHDSAAHGEKN